jgi:dTDP-4-dehydrorhamnose 3,5-epimerase
MRGGHAHYKTQQYILCLSGSVLVGINNGRNQSEKIIKPGEAVFIEELLWDYQYFLTGNDVIAVFCSTYYDEKDYINNFEKFLGIKNDG